MVKAIYRILITELQPPLRSVLPLQVPPGPARGPVACGVNPNVDALEHGLLEVLGIVGKHENMLRTNGGSYAGYIKEMLKGHIMVP